MNITKEMIDAFYEAHDKSLEVQPREHHQAIYDGLAAAVAVIPTPAVKVKPLEWKTLVHSGRHAEAADSVLGRWEVWTFPNGGTYTMKPGDYQGSVFEDEHEKAKEHMERAYQRRMAPAIEPAGVGVETVPPEKHTAGFFGDLLMALSRLAGNRQKDGVSSTVSREDRETIINRCHDLMIAVRQALAPYEPSTEQIEKAIEAYREGVYMTDEQVYASVTAIVRAALTPPPATRGSVPAALKGDEQ